MNKSLAYYQLNQEALQQIQNSNVEEFVQTHKIFEPVIQAGENLQIDSYVIGGWVRDLLLNRPSKDVDIVTPNNGIDLATETGKVLGNIPVNIFKNFGTAMVKTKEIEYEFVGARKESYSSDSRKPEVEQGTLNDDQKRRDFTINTLSIGLSGPNKGKLIDPFNGIGDLKNGILKTPLDPIKTYSDDPLRMMRAIRFATQFNFEIDKASFQAIASQKERIHIISKERINVELEKIMLSPEPSIGFLLLEKTGLLKILIPELTALKGVTEEGGQTHKENFYHTLEVVDNISKSTNNVWLRYAALFHDIGKAPTKRFDKKVGFTFHGHEAVGAKMITKIFKRLKLPLDNKLKYVKKMVYMSSRPIAVVNENVSDSGVRRLLFDAGDDIDDLMILCDADITSKNPYRVKKYRQNFVKVREKMKKVEDRDKITNFQSPVSGEEIMDAFGLKPCREIGTIKTQIKEAILEGDIKNDHEEALKLMLKIGNDLGLKTVKG
jgi:tRNA nucleotidyltransferase (CCA-adding enzyme)